MSRFCSTLAVLLTVAGTIAAGEDAAIEKTLKVLDGVFLRDDKADGKPIVEVSFSRSKQLKDADMKAVGKLTELRFLMSCERQG